MIAFTLPGMRLVNLANDHTHWRVRQRRAADQRGTARIVARAKGVDGLGFPVSVTITRIGPGRLDSDGLIISAKHVRDGIADAMGIDDADDRVQWFVTAERAKEWAVRIVVQRSELASGQGRQGP